MNKVALTVMGVMLATSAAAESVNQTQDAQADGSIDIYNLSGSIEIVGWDRKQIRVTGEIGDDVEALVFHVSGSQARIKVKIPGRVRGHKDVSADLVIHVPAGSSIDVGSVSADIDVEKVTGELELQSVSGDLVIDVFGSDVDAETVSGDVDVDGDGRDADVRLESVSGDVRADGLAGDLNFSTVSGDLDLTNGNFDRVVADTVNGDINLAMALRSGGKLNIETVNGTVDVDFIGDVDARFDIETFSGRIRNCFGPDAERTSRYAPGWELSFEEGDGNGRVTISTLNGGVRFCKE